MKNIEYLEEFFRKHKLSGKINVKYTSSTPIDEYMSDIVFENGDVININDVIFDIDSGFPNDVYEQWMESRKKKDMRLIEWIQTNTHYIPKDMYDTSSVDAYQNELKEIINEVKENINRVFQTEVDDNEKSGDE